MAAGCGDDGASLTPVPPEVSAGPVRITTDPFTVTVDDEVVAEAVAFGVADPVDPDRYYELADGAGVTWRVPTRAIAASADGWLVLDTGGAVRLSPGPDAGSAVLEVDGQTVTGAVLVRLALPATPGEPIYGFGESLGGADAAGQWRQFQLRVDFDSESDTNEAHVPVPVALWPRRGLGAFIEDRRPGSADVGATDPTRVVMALALPERGPVRTHVFTAADPLGLVRAYVARTALPAVPPRWAFAPQQWRNEHRSSDEVRADAQAMRALGIPGSALWIDNPWQTAYNTFTFDESRFAGSAALLQELIALGYRPMVWSTPYVGDQGLTAPEFDQAATRRFLVTDDGGRALAFPWQNGPGGLVDFTRPGATAWWRERIARVTALGVAGFKLDFGEEVVPELGGQLFRLLLAGGDSQVMHGIYARGYHDAYLGALPAGDGFVITRAGAWGEQDRNTAVWPGDLDNDFSRHGGADGDDGERNVGGLPAAIAAGLSLSVSGYPFFGSDIGGFRGGVPTTEVLIRWSQYAALGTIMQLGGGGESHNPWDAALFAPPALDVYRTYARLHMDLVPTLYTLALQAGRDGTPVTRPARFAYPCACDDAMFLLGDALLAAPVIEAGATTRDVVLPPGEWIDVATGARALGDGVATTTVPAPLTAMPLWRRAGAMVATYARAADTLAAATAPGVTSYLDPAFGRELAVTTTPEPAAAEVVLHDGALARAEVVGAAYRLQFAPGSEYDVVTFVLDRRATTVPSVQAATGARLGAGGAALPAAADLAALAACPAPGCVLVSADEVRVRAWADAGQLELELTP
ncbi:MAG: hypothetical protein KBG28_12100 [Kofleriaceae bacterium]|nr:hypothetical protein [Kofleriaceae bacterium]MBP9204701.1 hypothetical protein [Kofleriaceae bacterium]